VPKLGLRGHRFLERSGLAQTLRRLPNITLDITLKPENFNEDFVGLYDLTGLGGTGFASLESLSGMTSARDFDDRYQAIAFQNKEVHTVRTCNIQYVFQLRVC